MTGTVERVQERLTAIEHLPVDEHVAAFDGIHRLLQDALAALDGE